MNDSLSSKLDFITYFKTMTVSLVLTYDVSLSRAESGEMFYSSACIAFRSVVGKFSSKHRFNGPGSFFAVWQEHQL